MLSLNIVPNQGLGRFATLVIGGLALAAALALLRWGVWDAVFRPDAEACRALDHDGACWGVVAEKYRLILFGRYPYAEQWRPALATGLLLGALAFSAWRPAPLGRLAAVWLAAGGGFLLLMAGGGGLAPVASELWGGLPLTLLLTLASMAGALPLALALALGRQSSLPALRALCAAYVELLRALPLVPVLFLAAFLLPLALPEGQTLAKLPRLLLAIALFAAAYLAEAIRGGLAAVPRGQLDAAAALGLSPWQIRRHILLPQALRAALPALVNSFIGTLKESSLVTVVSLYELTGSLSLALNGDPVWRPFFLEGYLFIGAIYWTLCFGLSRASRRLEANRGQTTVF